MYNKLIYKTEIAVIRAPMREQARLLRRKQKRKQVAECGSDGKGYRTGQL